MYILIISSLFLSSVADVGHHNRSSSQITSVIRQDRNYNITTQEFESKKTCEDAGKLITYKFPSVQVICTKK